MSILTMGLGVSPYHLVTRGLTPGAAVPALDFYDFDGLGVSDTSPFGDVDGVGADDTSPFGDLDGVGVY